MRPLFIYVLGSCTPIELLLRRVRRLADRTLVR